MREILYPNLNSFPELDKKCVRLTAILLKDDLAKNWTPRSHEQVLSRRENHLSRDVRDACVDDLLKLDPAWLAIFESIVNDAEFQPEKMRFEFINRLCAWVKAAFEYIQCLKHCKPAFALVEEKRELLREMEV